MGSRPSTPSFRSEPYTGSISVSIRPNPCFGQVNLTWQIDESRNVITNVNDNSSFEFDNIFGAHSSVDNRSVYSRACAPIVQRFLHDGYNSTLFAYGMTGSGKTYSMRGEDHDPGFVRLAIDDIFYAMELLSSRTMELSVSYLEIYNEKLVDLLSSLAPVDLRIRDDPEMGVKIIGVTNPVVQSKDHLLSLIRFGDQKRKTSATDFNARSLRSHAILQFHLQSIDLASNSSVSSTLYLCDLAGSERATSSAERRKEGAYINKSLLALSTVINKLSLMLTTMGAGEHVPYRDSKLTRLLQPALSGNSLISILCTIHMGLNQTALNNQFATETYNTLRFAARSKDIVVTVNANEKHMINGSDTQRLIIELKRTVEEQKLEIQSLRLRSAENFSGAGTDGAIAEYQSEIMLLNEKLEHLNRLTDLHKTETVLLRNDALNDILGLDVEKVLQQRMMSNLEEFFKRVNYETDEYKAYIQHLESQLKQANQRSLLSLEAPQAFKSLTQNHYESLLKEQEEEILHLRETISDKDLIIQGLTKTSRLRRLVDASNNHPGGQVPRQKRPSGTLPSPGKENLVDVKEFNLSPKRPQV